MANIAYKYRIYPNQQQKAYFMKTFGCCRFIWNAMLSDKNAYYHDHGKMLHNTPAQYKDAHPFLREVDSLALANVQQDLQTAFKNFFNNPKTGFPKFKSRKRCHFSYTTNNVNNNLAVLENRIKLPKIGTIKAVVHRIAPTEYTLKSATVSMEHDGTFYCSVLYEYSSTQEPADISRIQKSDCIGLDYKSASLFMDSDGRDASMPHYYRESQKRFAKLQRKLSRTKGSRKGEKASNNHKKMARKVAKCHRHTANQRNDMLHKYSTAISKQYTVVCVEDLNMRNLANKGFGNGKATLDNGYGRFLEMLAYKQDMRGHYLIKVDKFFPSSQLTHCCGARVSEMKDLNRREITCLVCGKTYDRDWNAAINVRDEGYRILCSEQ